MGNLYENINTLCIEKGIKPSKLCADTGISRGLITDLKMGRKNGVTAVTAQKIANYFGVTVGYLLGEEDNKKSSASNDAEHITNQNGLNSSNYNIVKIAARNGNFIEKRLSDEDLAVITRIIDTLPDASDNL